MEIFGIPLSAMLSQLLLGLVNGSFYATLSLGLAIIFGLLNVINFAHGALFMLGAMLTWMGLSYFNLPYWVMLVLAPLIVGAFVSLVAGYALFLRAGVTPDYPGVVLPTVILLGLAFGLGFSALTVSATAGVPNSEQGLAASLFQTSFQVGGAIVLAVVTAVVDAGGGNNLTSAPAVLTAYRPALGVITGVAGLGLLVALPGLVSRRTTD